MFTFMKLRSGDWGVRATDADADNVKDGQEVTVKKRDGSTTKERIEKVVFRKDGVAICALAPKERPSGSGLLQYERGVGIVCQECGERARPGSQCWETGMMH